MHTSLRNHKVAHGASAFSLAEPQSCFPYPDDGPRPVRHLQRAEDVGDVVAHRFEDEAQLLGDLLLGSPLRDEIQPFDLPLAQCWKEPFLHGDPGSR